MKIKANDYKPNEIIKIIREWTGLTQEQFGQTINKSKHTVQSMELDRNNVYLHTLLEIAKVHKVEIIIQKQNHNN